MFNKIQNHISDNTVNFQINSGSLFLDENINSKCFLPKQDWKNLPNQISKKQLEFNNSTAFISIHPRIIELFWTKIIKNLFNNPLEIRKNILKNLVTEVISSLDKHSNITIDKIYSYELLFNPPHLESTAYNHQEKFTVGLHIDTHNVHAISERINGFQLLGLNLGNSYRYFQFVNLSVNDMMNKLHGKNSYDYDHIRNLKDDFLTQFSCEPIIRAKLFPGQAYIAQTQNYIHDGATNHEGHRDICLLMGGYFQWQQ